LFYRALVVAWLAQRGTMQVGNLVRPDHDCLGMLG
jgi:hypothetical protein